MGTPAERTDDELVRSAAGGDVASFEALVQRYGVRLVQFLRLSCKLSLDEAEDAAHDVWINVWYGIAASSITFFRSWLFTVARNTASRRGRRAARLPMTRLAPGCTDPNAQPPDRPAEVADQVAKLAACRDKLPPKFKAVVDGFVRGQTDKDLASEMGVSASTIRTRFFRAKALLRVCMGEE